MRHAMLLTLIGLCLAVGTVHGKPLSENAEVAEFQKLELIVRKQVEVGVSSLEQLLKARMLETRALYVNRELSQAQWLARETKLNADLVKIQSSAVSQGKNAVDQVFEFQNWLLSTRELLRRGPGAEK